MLGYVLHRMSFYFTAGFQTGKEKTGKRKGNSLATGEGTKKGRQRSKSGKRHRRAGQRLDGTETKTVICRVGSERSPCPVMRCFWRQEADASHGSGYVSVRIGTVKWNKISPSGFLPFDPVLMRRRSLRLPSPNPFPQLGRQYRSVFSGGKLPSGIFCPENRRPERGGIRPPSYLIRGTCQVKRGL